MAKMGIDVDSLENPKQTLPPIEARIAKLERYIAQGGPRAGKYRQDLEVYKAMKEAGYNG